MNFNPLIGILLFSLGIIITSSLVYWKYNKEMSVRDEWIKKKLKKGKWKRILAMVVSCYFSFIIGDLVFYIMPNSFILKPFFYAMFVVSLFTLFYSKYFYEMLGGKRIWKL